MTRLMDKDTPALFLGVAEFVEESNARYPFGGIDLFQLAQHKGHIVYPGMISSNEWVILVSSEFIKNFDITKWEIHITDEHGNGLAKANFLGLENYDSSDPATKVTNGSSSVVIFKDCDFILLHFKTDVLVREPGRYIVKSNYKGVSKDIGSIHFHYKKAPSLTPDQIKAIESDPNSAKAIQMELGCKNCPTKLNVYTGLKRQPNLERKGWVWQTDLPDKFHCECGKTDYSLIYMKESMHGILTKDFSKNVSGLSYVRRYGYSQVVNVVKQFTDLLDTETLEPPVQQFIEAHPILLSRFHAKRLFVKPNIVGRFQADFAMVDSTNQLVFIELEKPSLKLFKKDGHPTAELMHAYGQVTDWIHQFNKYPGVILDSLGLKSEEVVAVRGSVIAGRSISLSHDVLQRHLSNPPYPNIEFLTIDDLGSSLLAISKKLV